MEKIINDGELYNAFIEKNPTVIMIIDSVTGDIERVNQAAVKFYGYSKDEFLKLNISDINIYSKEDIYIEMQLARRQNRNHFNFIHKMRDGKLLNVSVLSYPIKYKNGEYLFSIISDRNKIITNSNFFDIGELINNTPDVFCVVDSENILEGQIVYANKAFTEITGIDWKELHIKSLNEIFMMLPVNNNDKEVKDNDACYLKDKGTGQTCVMAKCFKAFFDYKKYTIINIKPMEYNRISSINITNEFVEYVKDVFGDAEGYLLGIEFYGPVNLKQKPMYNCSNLISEIENILNKNQISFCKGNYKNSFVIFSSNLLVNIANAINEFIKVIEYDKMKSRNYYNMKIRAGISNKDKISKKQIDSLMVAMTNFSENEFNMVSYAAKSNEHMKNRAIKSDLKKAIINNEFVLYGQFIVDIEEKCIEGIEVLIRWEHPVYGVIGPSEFIMYAEVTGLIREIDLWVLKETLFFIEENYEYIKSLKVHVNLSVKSIENTQLMDVLLACNKKIVHNVILEITEESNIDINSVIFENIKSLGFKFAIDDFGTGYSSFERIRNTGVKYIKIDRSFIKNITNNPNDIVILRTILNMCSSLEIEVIAEGVETIEQIEFLYSKNCQLIQGYLFSKPKKINELIHKLNKDKESILQKIKLINSNNSIEKNFFNTGNIIVQEIDDQFFLINPNTKLLKILLIKMDCEKRINFLDFIEKEDKNNIEKLLKDNNIRKETYSVTANLVTSDNNTIKSVIAIKKSKVRTANRVYIEVMTNSEEDQSELIGLSHSYIEAFHKAPVGIMILSDDFKVLKWNETSKKIFGYDYKEVRNMNILKYIAKGNQLIKMNRLMNKACKNSKAEMNIMNRTNNDKNIFCEWVINKVNDSKSEKHKYICIVNDITEKVK